MRVMSFMVKNKKGGFYEKSPPLKYQLNIADKGF
jgi:hypothetical protein